ncbi:MAG: tetratricopeptide repeat protein, partial [Okeania sp. SIO3B3]|nr:tetratricopeptide repeat protein [Okeania sp. SIO3B3]
MGISHLEAQLTTVTDASQRIDLLNSLGWQLRYHNPERAIALTREAQTLAIQGEFAEAPYHKGIIQSLRNLSHLHYRTGNYVEAIHTALRALNLTEKHPPTEDKFTILDIISNIYFELGDYDTGLEHALRGLELAREQQLPQWEAAFLGDVGYVYLQLEEPEKALSHLLNAATFEGYAESKFYADDLESISQAYRLLGNYDAALDYGTRSLSLYQSLGIKQDEMSALVTLGKVYHAQGAYEKALTHFEAALYLSQDAKDTPLLIHILNWKADIYYKLDRLVESLTIVHGALNMALNHGLKPEQMHSYQLLSNIYKQQRNYQAALTYYEKYYETQQAMATEQTNKRLNVLEVVHEVERTRQEASLYQLRNEALQQEIAERKTVEAALRQVNMTLETRTKTLEAINWITQTAAASLDLKTMLADVTREITTLLDVTSTAIGMLVDDDTALEIVAEYTTPNDANLSAVGIKCALR